MLVKKFLAKKIVKELDGFHRVEVYSIFTMVNAFLNYISFTDSIVKIFLYSLVLWLAVYKYFFLFLQRFCFHFILYRVFIF